MCLLEDFILSLQSFLTGGNTNCNNLIRKHTKKLDVLGDISFPLNISNWYQLLGSTQENEQEMETIFNYNFPKMKREEVINKLIELSTEWVINIQNVTIRNNDAHVFINRSASLYTKVLKQVLGLGNSYGSCGILNNKIHIKLPQNIEGVNLEKVDLSTLRLSLIAEVAVNLVNFTTNKSAVNESEIFLVTNPIESCYILCGPVINEKGVKSSYTTEKLYQKRSSDMRMMAQHKYGVQVKPNEAWENYFLSLGKGTVTIEMLTNKPQKSIKISPFDLQTANKGASFIFYNCAKLSALFKEFEKKISNQEYPSLPELEQIDFSLLNQPEEWELFYVYILQFPTVIVSCIKDIEKGLFNPQHLISFLSNLSSVFSVYYRRIRILTNSKEHMFFVMHARIYLLKALQCVFHNSLHLLNIEPIKEM